jgi:hypothetical protein
MDENQHQPAISILEYEIHKLSHIIKMEQRKKKTRESQSRIENMCDEYVSLFKTVNFLKEGV